jgi:site-specific recombinase XerD
MPDLPALLRGSKVPETPAGRPSIGPDAADVAGSFARETRRAYASDWKTWAAWASANGRSGFPAAPHDVADFLKHQALELGHRMATVKRRLVAISQIHRLGGADFDSRAPALHFAMRRLSREVGLMQSGKAELMTVDIEAMLEKLSRDLAGKRDKALILLGFAGGFRRGELVAIDYQDIAWHRDGIVVTLRRSKTDQEGHGQTVGIRYGQRDRTCPVRALKAWLSASGISDGAIFRTVIHGKVGARLAASGKTVARLIKATAAKAGLDASRVSGHSLRVGHVTQALDNGADITAAQKQLRHKRLETTQRYDRGTSALKKSSSGKLGL